MWLESWCRVLWKGSGILMLSVWFIEMGFVLGEDESRDGQVGEACFGALVDEIVGNNEHPANFAESLRDLLGFVETSKVLTSASSQNVLPRDHRRGGQVDKHLKVR